MPPLPPHERHAPERGQHQHGRNEQTKHIGLRHREPFDQTNGRTRRREGRPVRKGDEPTGTTGAHPAPAATPAPEPPPRPHRPPPTTTHPAPHNPPPTRHTAPSATHPQRYTGDSEA
jgi:hypothetical protein